MSDVAPVEDGTLDLPGLHFTLAGKKKGLKPPRHGDLLKALTLNIVGTYAKCSNEFKYSDAKAPRRWLTKPWKGVHNSKFDNIDHDYICSVGDKIPNPDDKVYEIIEALGQGAFGQVLRCVAPGNPPVALKIIKNKPDYFQQALSEVRILKYLNEECDPNDECHIVRMHDFFVYRKHLCIVFELLIGNLFDVLRQNNYTGFPLPLIRELTRQLLKALQCLAAASIIHCDLKPENILLSSTKYPIKVKLCDLGSACFKHCQVSSYIQSRFYRSPEVLIGMRYNTAIDIWSLGCICGELFLGLPIFPGVSQYDQLRRILGALGPLPVKMLREGKHTKKYFCPASTPLPAKATEIDQPSLGWTRPTSASGTSSASGQAPAAHATGSAAPAAAAAAGPAAGSSSSSSAAGPGPAIAAAGGGPAAAASAAAAAVAVAAAAATSATASSSDTAAAASQDAKLAVATATAEGTEPKTTADCSVPLRLRTREEYERETGKKDRTPRKQGPAEFRSLNELMERIKIGNKLKEKPSAYTQEIERRGVFLEFLTGMLQLAPEDRLTAVEAMQHPFMSSGDRAQPAKAKEQEQEQAQVQSQPQPQPQSRPSSQPPSQAQPQSQPQSQPQPQAQPQAQSQACQTQQVPDPPAPLHEQQQQPPQQQPQLQPQQSQPQPQPQPVQQQLHYQQQQSQQQQPPLSLLQMQDPMQQFRIQALFLPAFPPRRSEMPNGQKPAQQQPQEQPLPPQQPTEQASSSSSQKAGPRSKHQDQFWQCYWNWLQVSSPELNTTECYRPQIEQLPLCWSGAMLPPPLLRPEVAATERSARSAPGGGGGRGTWSDSAGASMCSSADSTGSTPSKFVRRSRTAFAGNFNNAGRGRNVPLSARGGIIRGVPGRRASKGMLRNPNSSVVTPSSTPQNSSLGSGTPSLGGGKGTFAGLYGRPDSQDEVGKANSPWHLSSRLSMNSTLSDCPSGMSGFKFPGNEATSEDFSHSDTSGMPHTP